MDAGSVTFDPFNMYANNPTEKENIIKLVISQAPAGAASATVVRSDRRRHCTVDYYDAAGARISREHII
ncbi:hypothetical protein BDV59DRAFT_206638 [Aspergillus ambiguus]|uniref:uncharacterized protein n=1 Tax=Aspergillus ambiguus TaxID=176160 RepID=UPI003CCDA1CB